MFDGQSVLAKGKDRGMDNDVMCWNVSESVSGMMAATDNKAIIVCIDNGSPFRSDELVPDLGEFAEKEYKSKKKGGDFARFMADTLVPYIRQHYNVCADALHTSVTGASLGGLETFYITMEYPEIFGTAGVLSPSFWTYDDAAWKSYLGKKDFVGNTPFVYLYTGPAGGDTDPYVTEMYNRMKDMGYPADKIALHYSEDGLHHPNSWRGCFSEFLSAMAFQRVEPLQK